MFNRISLEQAKGKIFETIVFGLDEDTMLVVFNDGSFLEIETSHDINDNHSMSILPVDINCLFDWELYDRESLIKSGVVSEKEMKNLIEEEKKKREDNRNKWEWDKYQELKKKFEGENQDVQ